MDYTEAIRRYRRLAWPEKVAAQVDDYSGRQFEPMPAHAIESDTDEVTALVQDVAATMLRLESHPVAADIDHDELEDIIREAMAEQEARHGTLGNPNLPAPRPKLAVVATTVPGLLAGFRLMMNNRRVGDPRPVIGGVK